MIYNQIVLGNTDSFRIIYILYAIIVQAIHTVPSRVAADSPIVLKYVFFILVRAGEIRLSCVIIASLPRFCF